MEHLHRIRSTLQIHPPDPEILPEMINIHRSRRHNDLQGSHVGLFALSLGIANNPKQDVGIYRPLVDLIEEDHAIVLQQSIGNSLAKQATVCYEADLRGLGRAILETHGETDSVA